jgi:hypothetical protein
MSPCLSGFVKGLGYIHVYLISQKWLEKNAEKTIKIISEVIIMRYVQL